jgi:hypothetical protein
MTYKAENIWHRKCAVSGGWVWIFDQIAGTNQVAKYAKAINLGDGGTSGVAAGK